jgi:hypothetical protein
MKQDAELPPNRTIRWVWRAALLLWLIGLCFIPDPRPLSAPAWAIKLTQSTLVDSEPKARFIATVVLRTAGLGMIGILLAMSLQGLPMRWAAMGVLLGTPLLAVGVKWFNFGYFPIWTQLQFILAIALFSGLAGLALRRSRIAAMVLVLSAGLLFMWGVSTRVSVDLEQAARATGQHLLDNAAEIPSGDKAFSELLRSAFAYAEDNSHKTDAVFCNKAAILALGVIMGDDQVVRVGWSEISPSRKKEREALRRRVTVHGRNDLPRHFAVSAALTVLADENRALTVGITKEASDSNPGGSGFSFVDMLANKAGIRLAVVATQDAQSARMIQKRIKQSHDANDFMPKFDELPEGLSSDAFQSDYGGLGGSKTMALFEELDRRVNACAGLQPSSK